MPDLSTDKKPFSLHAPPHLTFFRNRFNKTSGAIFFI
jgi:hypothetical protein